MKTLKGIPEGRTTNLEYDLVDDPDPDEFLRHYKELCGRLGLHLFVRSDDQLHVGFGCEPVTGSIEHDLKEGVAFFRRGPVYFPPKVTA